MIVVQVQAKCSDMFSLVMYDNSDITSEEILLEHEGYVLKSSLGDGDYVEFSVDNATGRIIGWVPIESFIS